MTNQEKCPHEHTTQLMTGWLSLINGEIYDNQELHIVCLDCGEMLTEEKPPIIENEEEVIPFSKQFCL